MIHIYSWCFEPHFVGYHGELSTQINPMFFMAFETLLPNLNPGSLIECFSRRSCSHTILVCNMINEVEGCSK